MGKCSKVKCATPECTVKMKQCMLKDGLCLSCYMKKLNEAKKKR